MRPVWKEISVLVQIILITRMSSEYVRVLCEPYIAQARKVFFFLLNSQFKTGKCFKIDEDVFYTYY